MNKVITLACIILSSTISAQDQIAKNILDKLSTTTQSYKNMTIEFSLTIENKSQYIKDYQIGTLILSKEQFRLIMDNQTIINDGETQWVYLREMNEVQILKHEDKDDLMNPNKLFNIHKKDYKYSYYGTESKNGKQLQIINLFPEKSVDFMKITIAVDTVKNQLNSISVSDKNGGTYNYLIRSFKSNTVIKPFTFNSELYPGIEIIDLR